MDVRPAGTRGPRGGHARVQSRCALRRDRRTRGEHERDRERGVVGREQVLPVGAPVGLLGERERVRILGQDRRLPLLPPADRVAPALVREHVVETPAVDAIRGIAVAVGVHPVLAPAIQQAGHRRVREVPADVADRAAVPRGVGPARERGIARVRVEVREVVGEGGRWMQVGVREVAAVLRHRVGDEIDEDLDALGVCRAHERPELGLGSEPWIHDVRGHVLVAVVGGRGEDGRHPDGRDAERPQVRQAGGHAAEVAESLRVPVGVTPGDRHDLVEHVVARIAAGQWCGGGGRRGKARDREEQGEEPSEAHAGIRGRADGGAPSAEQRV